MEQLKKSLSASQKKVRDVSEFLKKHYKFRYNEVSNAIESCKHDSDKWHQVSSQTLWHKCQNNLTQSVGVKYLENLLASNDFRPTYNPLQERIKEISKEKYVLPFKNEDAMGNLIQWIILEDYSEEAYVRLYDTLKFWFFSAVKTVFEKKFSIKNCITFLGPQTIGKTAFVENLLPSGLEDYKKKDPDLSNKDADIALVNNLLIYIDEVDKWKGYKSSANSNRYKSFFSTSHVKERLPYAKVPTSMWRNASLLATCNTSQFLNDESGTHRWFVHLISMFINEKNLNKVKNYPFSCEHEDYKQIINACWQQAYLALIDKKTVTISDEFLQENEEINEKYKYNSPEFEFINQYFEAAQNGEEKQNNVEFLTATNMMQYINQFDSNFNLKKTGVFGKALQRAGFIKKAKKIRGKVIYGYHVKKITQS